MLDLVLVIEVNGMGYAKMHILDRALIPLEELTLRGLQHLLWTGEELAKAHPAQPWSSGFLPAAHERIVGVFTVTSEEGD